MVSRREDRDLYTNPSEELLESMMGVVGECADKLLTIREIVADHFGTTPDDVTWADAESAKHVSEMLDDIMEFLGCKEKTMSV